MKYIREPREPVKKFNTRVWPPPYSSIFSLYPLSTHLLASVLMLATPTLHRYWRLPGPHCRGRHLSILCSHLDITENNLRCVEIGNLLTDIRCMDDCMVCVLSRSQRTTIREEHSEANYLNYKCCQVPSRLQAAGEKLRSNFNFDR